MSLRLRILGFFVAALASVGTSALLLSYDAKFIVDIERVGVSNAASFAVVTILVAAWFWFGPCAASHARGQRYYLFIIIANLAGFGLLSAALLLRAVAH